MTYRAIPAEEVLADVSPERRARIKARAAELIAEEYALGGLRKARRLTQVDVAKRLGGRQVYVSRLEKRADMKLSTLRNYVGALGGDLQLIVRFPEGRPVRLAELGADSKPAQKKQREGAARKPRSRTLRRA